VVVRVVVVSVLVSGDEEAVDVFSSNKVEIFTSSVSFEVRVAFSVVFRLSSGDFSTVVTSAWGATEVVAK
jgi:hypothetical protein